MNRKSRPNLLATVLISGILSLVLPNLPAAQVAPPAVDSEIVSLIDSISVDSLRAVIAKLQGFHTRHFNSDTLSSTVGIGAARRWVHDRFVDISNNNGGNLQVEYNSFVFTDAGITREHRNVVATLPGSDPLAEDRIFLIGGHLDSRNANGDDSTGYAPGANDDGSGVGAALELARIMARSSFEATVKFVAFTGEEQGLVGSGFLADEMAAAGLDVEGMLNNDMIGNVVYGEGGVGDSLDFDSTHVRMFSVAPSNSRSRQLARSVKIYTGAYVPTMGINLIPAQDRPGRGGDHISFNNAGFPAARMVDVFDNLIHQHSAGDSMQVMNFPYYARNVAIDLALLGNLSRAPRPVDDFVVGNVGDSTGFSLTWAPNPEADLAGYYITTRFIDSLDYAGFIDVGNTTAHTIALSPAESLWVGIAAYDNSGHLGLVQERLGILSAIPFAPSGLSATPDNSTIHLTWDPAPEGDFSHYNVYRAGSIGGPYIQQNGSPVLVPLWDDTAVLDGVFYYYKTTTVDLASNESALSESARGRLVSLTEGILFVDETENGSGQPHRPSDALSDAFYATVMDTFAHDVIDYDSAVAAGGISLSDLGAYSIVIWVSDDRNLIVSGVPAQNQFLVDNRSSIASYLDLGGKVLLQGWRMVGGIDDSYPVTFGAGDFLHDYFGAGTTGSTANGKFFYGAVGAGAYPTVIVDTSKTRNPWAGKLPDSEYFSGLPGGAEVTYTFNSSVTDSVFHGSPVGIRHDAGTFQTQFFGFPLYHLREADAKAHLASALGWFLESSTAVSEAEESESIPRTVLFLQGSPNPVSSAGTVVRYSIPGPLETELALYSVSGRRVRLIKEGHHEAGWYSATWDGRDDSGFPVASGIYFYRLAAGGHRVTEKVVYLR